jgi:hypothetical protein
MDHAYRDDVLTMDVLLRDGYPGRGCLAVRTTAGTLAFAYFLTGRSAASRLRRLRATRSGDIAVESTTSEAHDALRHYLAAVRCGEWTIIGISIPATTIDDLLDRVWESLYPRSGSRPSSSPPTIPIHRSGPSTGSASATRGATPFLASRVPRPHIGMSG